MEKWWANVRTLFSSQSMFIEDLVSFKLEIESFRCLCQNNDLKSSHEIL